MGIFTRGDQTRQGLNGSGRPALPGRPAEAQPYGATRSLTAAAQVMKLNSKSELQALADRRAGGEWQEEAWQYFDSIGEIKYAFTLVGSVVSRVRLYVGYVPSPTDLPVPVGKVAEDVIPTELRDEAERQVGRLATANGGIPGLLRDTAINLSVTGECYLVQTQRASVIGKEKWRIVSTRELEVDRSGNPALRETAGQRSATPLSPDTFVGRIWRPHASFSADADSSMRALLDLSSELLLLNRAYRATAKSRLNAGALFVPDGLSVTQEAVGDIPPENAVLDPVTGEPLGPGGEGVATEQAEDDDAFEQELIDAMTTPISDEDSASAVVPLLIRGPAELGNALRQLKFERSFDEELTKRGDTVLARILQGIDIPKDVITGLANVRYSNALADRRDRFTERTSNRCCCSSPTR